MTIDVAAQPWPVRAGLELLDEEGFEAVTVRAVAARAGRTPMAVYRHVEDVDDLLRRVVRLVFEHWESRVYGVLDVADPLRRLERYAHVYLSYAREHPNRYDVLFVLGHGIGTDRFPEGFGDEAASTFRILREAVAEARTSEPAGEGPRDPSPDEVALGLWSTVHGLVMLRRSGRFPDERAFGRVFRGTVSRLLQALGPADGSPGTDASDVTEAAGKGEPG
ncbi:MAG: TetR/AcrR family transcriptional regulator [Gemmatimonadota bacterium]